MGIFLKLSIFLPTLIPERVPAWATLSGFHLYRGYHATGLRFLTLFKCYKAADHCIWFFPQIQIIPPHFRSPESDLFLFHRQIGWPHRYPRSTPATADVWLTFSLTSCTPAAALAHIVWYFLGGGWQLFNGSCNWCYIIVLILWLMSTIDSMALTLAMETWSRSLLMESLSAAINLVGSITASLQVITQKLNKPYVVSILGWNDS